MGLNTTLLKCVCVCLLEIYSIKALPCIPLGWNSRESEAQALKFIENSAATTFLYQSLSGDGRNKMRV